MRPDVRLQVFSAQLVAMALLYMLRSISAGRRSLWDPEDGRAWRIALLSVMSKENFQHRGHTQLVAIQREQLVGLESSTSLLRSWSNLPM